MKFICSLIGHNYILQVWRQPLGANGTSSGRNYVNYERLCCKRCGKKIYNEKDGL